MFARIGIQHRLSYSLYCILITWCTEEPIHLEHGDKLISHIAAGELEFIHTPFHCSLMRDCIVSTMLATMYNVMIKICTVNRNIVYRDCLVMNVCTRFISPFLSSQTCSCSSWLHDVYLYLVTIPKPGFKFGDRPNISMQQHTTIMNCRPLVYVHWKEKQHNWVKKEKKLKRMCNSSSARSLPERCCRGGAMGFWLE